MSRITTKQQVSVGGVVFRKQQAEIEVALISVGPQPRWQLPKGMVEKDEAAETAALREVREETGITANLIAPIDVVEFWYHRNSHGESVRYHKYVHFFLMSYERGDVADHDHEVNEARWIEIETAKKLLTFISEKRIIAKAHEIIMQL